MNNNLKNRLVLLGAIFMGIVYLLIKTLYGNHVAISIFNTAFFSIEIILIVVSVILILCLLVLIFILLPKMMKKSIVPKDKMIFEAKVKRVLDEEKINGKIYLTEEQLSFLPAVKIETNNDIEEQAVLLKLSDISDVKMSNSMMKVFTDFTEKILIFEGEELYSAQQILKKLISK